MKTKKTLTRCVLQTSSWTLGCVPNLAWPLTLWTKHFNLSTLKKYQNLRHLLVWKSLLFLRIIAEISDKLPFLPLNFAKRGVSYKLSTLSIWSMFYSAILWFFVGIVTSCRLKKAKNSIFQRNKSGFSNMKVLKSWKLKWL